MRWCGYVVVLAACGHYDFDRVGQSVDGDGGLGDGNDSDTMNAVGWSLPAAGNGTSCAVYQGRAYCWGRGVEYEIGDGFMVNRARPTEVQLPTGTITQIAMGEGHGCAVVNAQAHCWGNYAIGTGVFASPIPAHVVALPDPVHAVAAGVAYACAIADASRTVFCWGEDPVGSLGNDFPEAFELYPVNTNLSDVVALDSGGDHMIALRGNGDIYVWGHNDYGIFGDFPTYQAAVPLLNPQVTAATPKLAGLHACGLKAGGVLCWGYGRTGELGDGRVIDEATPVVPVGMDAGVTAIDVGSGPFSVPGGSCAVKNGSLYCWGGNTTGRLGVGDTDQRDTPVLVPSLPADITDVAMGHTHTCARSSDGTLSCWGEGVQGQLGDGANTNSLTAVVVPLP